MSPRRTLAITISVLLLATAPAAVAHAVPMASKKISQEQVKALLPDGATAAAYAGYPGTLTPNQGPECVPVSGQSTYVCRVRFTQSQDGAPFPYWVSIAPFASASAAKKYLATSPSGAMWTVARKEPTRRVSTSDYAPNSGFGDAVSIEQVSGRFFITVTCGLQNTMNNFGAMSECAQSVVNQMVKKVKPYK